MIFKNLAQQRNYFEHNDNAPVLGFIVETWDFGQVVYTKLLLTTKDNNGFDIMNALGNLMYDFDIDSEFGNRCALSLFQRHLAKCLDGYLSRFDVATVSLDELSLSQKVDALNNFAQQVGSKCFESDELATFDFLAKHPLLADTETNFNQDIFVGSFAHDE